MQKNNLFHMCAIPRFDDLPANGSAFVADASSRILCDNSHLNGQATASQARTKNESPSRNWGGRCRAQLQSEPGIENFFTSTTKLL